MELRQVETFRAVAKELSFSRAAAKLGYVQSSVSVQVSGLEQELGVPLFDRLGRRIALTDAGRVMLGYSEKLLGLAEEAKDAVVDAGVGSGEITGSLTVSAPETLLTYRLPKLLALFHAGYPKVRLSLRPSAIGKLVGAVRREVEEGKVDVAFVLDEPVLASGLSVEPLVEEAISVIAPASHMLASSTLVVPRDLRGETMLLPEAPESGCAYRGQFERQLSGAGVVPSETIEFTSIEAVKQCVAAGMGISVLPSVVVESELKGERLSALRWGEPFGVATQMAWHEERWRSPALETFLETARNVFAPTNVS
ncbi:MAG: LysR family transcriptional regulator [Actinobacteria bacterium]|nr:LysR family transcriptional regulator [Actinomycetota bacterium]